MKEQNRLWKWALVVFLLAAALFALYPPQDRLKGGIDLAGGTVLLYEIDTTGLEPEQTDDLADRVMSILKRRVDPTGQLNLIWRPIGKTRLEIQMPRPPEEVQGRREAYKKVLSKIRDLNVNRIDIELALNDPTNWASWVEGQGQLVAERSEKLATLKEAHTAYRAAQGELDADLSVEDAAEAAYDKALEDVERTVLHLGRLEDVLALQSPRERKAELAKLRSGHPSYATLINEVVAEYETWSLNKGALEDPSDLKRRIRGAGVLEFRILAERDPTNPGFIQSADPNLREPIARYVDQLRLRGPRSQAGGKYGWFAVEKIGAFMSALRDKDESAFDSVKDGSLEIIEKYAGNYYVLMHTGKEYGLLHEKGSKWKLVRAMPYMDPQSGRPAVSFALDARGGRLFGELTRTNIKRQLTILLDGAAMSHATIQTQINERGQITGDFTEERVRELVTVLEAGSLPARLKETPLMEYTIGPSLGKYNRDQGMRAAVYGMIAVAGFMLIYYLFAGLVANVALVLNLLFTLAVMATLQATFTLPGIAGMILTVGMAVDANVLILERFREERRRGLGLMKALRLGYDRAFSTIVDANITTLITCVILGYVGSEEVKGFAMTLGFGVVTSMFTALFVTRLVFTSLIDIKLLKNLPMLRLIGQPTVDWLSLRRVFWPFSLAVVIAGGAFFVTETMHNKEALYDIEFLGGSSVQIELKEGVTLSDEEVRQRVTADEPGTVASWLEDAADRLAAGQITAGSIPGEFRIQTSGLTPGQVGAMLRTTIESQIARNGLSGEGDVTLVETKIEADLDLAAFTKLVQDEEGRADQRSVVEYVRGAAGNLSTAKVQTVAAVEEDEGGGLGGLAYELVTVETAKDLVQTAVMAVLGDDLEVQRALAFDTVVNPETGQEYFPIDYETRYLDDIQAWSVAVGGTAHFDVQRYKGGVAMVFDNLTPAQPLPELERRIREIRLLPEFEGFQWRDYELFGLGAADTSGDNALYSKVAMVVVDPVVPYDDDPTKWEDVVAQTELDQAKLALSSEKSLRKVVQFAPTVAAMARTKAVQAILLALAAIVAYIWLRFGNMQFGLAAIVALVHDVSVPLGAMTLLDVLGVADLRINMPVIAAFLAIIGYSLNDTIVVFDRVRENRGKLTRLTAPMINQSINQTLSRTLLTSTTTFLAVFIMLVWGGPGMYGFAFAMTIGVLSGTYSSLAIAVPLVYRPKVLHIIVYILIALALFAVIALAATGYATTVAVFGLLIGAGLITMIYREIRTDRTDITPKAN
ncbi:MAG: protein translocase subunit SecD [bacterium]|nr:protein translocase subunit SecD [bacterium]